MEETFLEIQSRRYLFKKGRVTVYTTVDAGIYLRDQND